MTHGGDVLLCSEKCLCRKKFSAHNLFPNMGKVSQVSPRLTHGAGEWPGGRNNKYLPCHQSRQDSHPKCTSLRLYQMSYLSLSPSTCQENKTSKFVLRFPDKTSRVIWCHSSGWTINLDTSGFRSRSLCLCAWWYLRRSSWTWDGEGLNCSVKDEQFMVFGWKWLYAFHDAVHEGHHEVFCKDHQL